MSVQQTVIRIVLVQALGLMVVSSFAADSASKSGGGVGKTPMDAASSSLIVDYYEKFLKDKDLEAFEKRVTARYNEATLGRLTTASDARARRAAVLSLGLTGSFASNAAVGKALKDPDPIVRAQASMALLAIWGRADTLENNAELEEVQKLLGEEKLDAVIKRATALIARAKGFAEAYNQRAFAYYIRGQYAESIQDCRRVLELNPYHFGALSGMGKCQIQLRQIKEAIETFRRASKLQPYSEGLKETIAELEALDN